MTDLQYFQKIPFDVTEQPKYLMLHVTKGGRIEDLLQHLWNQVFVGNKVKWVRYDFE